MAGGWLFIQERVKKFLDNQVKKISVSFFNCRTNCTALCMLSSLPFICPSDREMSEEFESCGQAAASLQVEQEGQQSREVLPVTFVKAWGCRLSL